ncbi:protein containing DUF1549 [Rhodopirellula maiorica SM1]|uniref:Protein containing DUF1549 n=1 Tax=Rhodopirellula maiorica SM1 TaxID=1265738 RepID=M5RSS3_9BACT|nr:DUF1553 domain-containing protein [Rhodopirellula maiorica]EMI17019.1 protein containing DUF1549 [Rhodopirellula maiorica SM1]
MPIACGLIAAGVCSADKPVDFNRDIRSILFGRCVACHGPDEDQRAAGLRLDTEAGSREDLGGYVAIKPGDPDDSELIERLTTDDDEMRMPPKGKGKPLSKDEIDLIRRWIEQGGSYAKHWSYEKPTRPALPSIEKTGDYATWGRNPIDAFVLAKLRSNQLEPSPEADRLTLARRLAIDLTGVPPSWQEAQAFVNDHDTDAYEKYVDQQLAKPTFGIRWARVWLDLARYADSAGYADDPLRTIWAYRDYVIDSLNQNKPFDQFTIEQIAGDLLENPTDEQLIATAFHRNTMTNNEGGTNDEEFRNVAVVDRVNTTMAVWMGTTMACAQCHTHKYDPITHDEYFQFFAFFNQSADRDRRDESPLHEVWLPEQLELKESLRTQITELESRLNQATPELETQQAKWLKSIREQPEWSPLVPAELSARHRQMTTGSDGWITAAGKKADRDTYTLQFPIADSRLAAAAKSNDKTATPQSLVGLKLEVGEEQAENFVLSKVSASWTPNDVHPMNARFVRVELPGKQRILHIAELQVFSGAQNVALSGTATQSSTGFNGPAKFAIDGNISGNFQDRTVIHTQTEDNPWWEVDLGAEHPVDRIALWNRTDGGGGISGRLAGYTLQLLDQDRNVIWHQSPEALPTPSLELSTSGKASLRFAAAFADYEQPNFTAASILADKIDNQKGWAIGGGIGSAHQLTLVLDRPLELAEGTLTLTLDQQSVHAKHLLNEFRVSMTFDADIARWAAMPPKIQSLLADTTRSFSESEQADLAAYYRSIAPSLDPIRKQHAKLETQLRQMKPATTVPIMQPLPENQRRKTNVQLRGNYTSLGNEVNEGTPAAFHPLRNSETPDRLDLARWLVDEDNPLTARVIANRHWEQIFGIGIVESSEEFGSQGELPSHPELLDWLATELQQNGWDIKAFLKLLVMSSTYRQSSVTSAKQQENDPMNRMLARGPRFRISAEMVRDQALFVAGLLSDKMGGPPVNPPQPELGLRAAFGGNTDWKTSEGEDRYRAGIYTSWRRSSPYPSMSQFDAPDRDVCTVRRIRTNTPLQALVTLNDPVYIEAAQSLARRTVAAANTTEARIRFIFQTTLIRNPKSLEIERIAQLVDEARSAFIADPDAAKAIATEPIGDVPEGADVTELAAWTVVGNVMLNLDELLMKR